MKKISLIITLIILQSSNICPMTGGVAAESQLLNEAIQLRSNRLGQSQAPTQTSQTSNIQSCPTPQATTTNPLPSFMINMYDAKSNLINTYTFSTNQTNFLVNNALLIIHIFPPSNTISGTAVNLSSSDSSYAVMYTLKSLDGTIIQKELQFITAASGSTPASAAVMIKKGVPQIPTAISISMITPATSSTAETSTIISSPASSPFALFLPNMSPHSVMTKQRIFNGVSPMSQKFLISVDSSDNISATQISGIFDVDNSSESPTLATSLLSSSGSAIAITPTSGANISPIGITISDGTSPQTITFSGTNIPFNQQDLLNGLACNIHIFPPSTGGSNYMIIATLRTLDGLKLRKQIIQQASFSNIPSQLLITQNSQQILSTTFLNPNTSSQAMMLVSPINLRCIIQKNNSSSKIIVSII